MCHEEVPRTRNCTLAVNRTVRNIRKCTLTSAQEAEEDGFGLVGARAAQRHAGGQSAGVMTVEEIVAGIAGGLLQDAGRGGEIERVKCEGEPQLRRQRADELGIAHRLRARADCGSRGPR